MSIKKTAAPFIGVVDRHIQDQKQTKFSAKFCLNLACGDAVRNFKLMKDALETTGEITKLIEKSPRRDACFERLMAEVGCIG